MTCRIPIGVIVMWLLVSLAAQEAVVRRRDPFVPLVSPPSSQAVITTASAPRPPGLAGLSAADVALTGIITRGTRRLALLRGPDGRTYLAREHDRVHDGVISRIDRDGVVWLTAATTEDAGREMWTPLRPTSGGGGR